MKNQENIKSIIDRIKKIYSDFKVKIFKINKRQIDIYRDIKRRKTEKEIELIRGNLNKIKKL